MSDPSTPQTDIISVTFTLSRTDMERFLRWQMSLVSEICWCAGWIGDTEEEVPRVCREALATNASVAWAMGYVSVETAQFLCGIADALGYWVDMDSKPYKPKCDQ